MDIWVVFVEGYDDIDGAGVFWERPVAYFSTEEKAKDFTKQYALRNHEDRDRLCEVDSYIIEKVTVDLVPEIEDMWWLDDKEEN